jgi:hypothetical protein
MRVGRALLGLLAAVSALVAGGPAQAALPKRPGIVVISDIVHEGGEVALWSVFYARDLPLGPAPIGNTVEAVGDGDFITFDSPRTLMLALPVTRAVVGAFPPATVNPEPACTSGLAHASCRYPVSDLFNFCIVFVGGGFGSDTITVRNRLNPNHYCYFNVVARKGNDVIDTRNLHADVVSCGLGYDRVVADSYDEIARDCESVYNP